jgi:hypothetical protein
MAPFHHSDDGQYQRKQSPDVRWLDLSPMLIRLSKTNSLVCCWQAHMARTCTAGFILTVGDCGANATNGILWSASKRLWESFSRDLGFEKEDHYSFEKHLCINLTYSTTTHYSSRLHVCTLEKCCRNMAKLSFTTPCLAGSPHPPRWILRRKSRIS